MVKEEIDKHCKYCGLEFPDGKLRRNEGEMYLLLKDADRENSPEDAPEYITICPYCVSTMVSTYQLGHKYEFVGVLENAGDSTNESEEAHRFHEQYRKLTCEPYHVLPCQKD